MTQLLELDRAIFLALFGGDHPGIALYAMIALTVVGRGYILWAIAALALLPRSLAPSWFRALTQSRQRIAREMLLVLVVVAVTVYLGKALVQRPRPYVQLGLVPLGGAPHDFSFPSGHASGAFAFACFLCARVPLRTSQRLSLLALALGISLSRIYLGAHFPSDVLAGSLLGGAMGWLTGRYFRRTSPQSW